MSIRILTDSASDILPEEAKALGITVIPLTINFDGTEYLDAITLSHKQFYEKLIESDTLPTTSQISPAGFAEEFESLTAQGHTVIAITLSGALSGTYQSACIAASDYPGKVYVVDSESVTVGQRLLILRALEMIRNGADAEEITRTLNEEKKLIRVLAVLDTLEYLKKGGRISAATAFAGGILSIKPVVTVKDGAVVLCGKARGSKNGSNLLRKFIEEDGGVDFDRPYAVGYSGITDALLQKYIADNADLWQTETLTLPIATVGGVIGTHVGPNAIALAYYMHS